MTGASSSSSSSPQSHLTQPQKQQQQGTSQQGTMSPRSPVMSRGESRDQRAQPQTRQPPFKEPDREVALKVRVLALETRGKDLCVRLDAITNHPSYRLSHYPPFLRSFRDLSFFALSLSIHVPTHILSSLPLPSPNFDSSPPESRLLSHRLAKWFARLTAEPAHRDHPETRNFIESEYSYQPIAPNPEFVGPLVQRRWRTAMDHAIQAERGMSLDIGGGLGLPTGVLSTPATPSRSKGSGFLGFGGGKSGASSSAAVPGGKGLSLSRNVNDEDEDLVAARMEVTRLELQFSQAAKQGDKTLQAKTKVTQELHALSNKLHTFAGLEDTRQMSHQMGLPAELRKLADGIPTIDVTQQAASNTDLLTLLYQLSYQSANARSAKEALLARNALVEEHHEASKRALLKKREVEGLKARMGVGSAGISRDRIEFAIEDFSEASRYAHALRQSLQAMSSTMHKSLQGHSRNAHSDLQQALVEHAKGNIFHLRKNILGLKNLRTSVKGEHVEGLGLLSSPDDHTVGSNPMLSEALPAAASVDEPPPIEVSSSATLTDSSTAESGDASSRPMVSGPENQPQATSATQEQPPRSEAMQKSTSTSSTTNDVTPSSSMYSEPNASTPTSTSSRATERRPPVRNPWTGSTDSGFSRDYTHQPVPAQTSGFSGQESITSSQGTGHHERFATPPLPRAASQSQSMFLSRPREEPEANQGPPPPPPAELPFASSSSGFLPRSDAGFGSQSRFAGGRVSPQATDNATPSASSFLSHSGGFNRGVAGSGTSTKGNKGRLTASDAAKSLAGRF
ncbi:unnamed protein product [Sympodiomycopsis kandeliae]